MKVATQPSVNKNVQKNERTLGDGGDLHNLLPASPLRVVEVVVSPVAAVATGGGGDRDLAFVGEQLTK